MIHANQFSNNKCDRLLLVHDDLAGKGLGWSVRFWNTALLAALQSNRKLHEEAASDVQSEMTEAKKNTSKLTNRWCDVPPYTLECFYKRWNSCEAIPPHHGLKLTWHKRGHSWGHGLSATPTLDSKPIIRMALSEFEPDDWPSLHQPLPPRLWNDTSSSATAAGLRDGMLMSPASSNATILRYGMLRPDATRLLFRPRKWISDIAECIANQANASTIPRKNQPYMVLFIRDSFEKRMELHQHSHGRPHFSDYDSITLTIANQLLRIPSVVLQTSSLSAYTRFERFAQAHNLLTSASANTRSDSDMWGGMRQGAQTMEGLVASVNLHLASRCQYFVGLSSSAWTHLVRDMMVSSQEDDDENEPSKSEWNGNNDPSSSTSTTPPPTPTPYGVQAEPTLHWCCHCGAADRYAQGLLSNEYWREGTEIRGNNVMLLRAYQPRGREVRNGGIDDEKKPPPILDLSNFTGRGACLLGPVLKHELVATAAAAAAAAAAALPPLRTRLPAESWDADSMKIAPRGGRALVVQKR